MPRSPNVTPVLGAGSYVIETSPPGVGAEHRDVVGITVTSRAAGNRLSAGAAAAILTTLASYYTTTVVAGLVRLGNAPQVILTGTGLWCTVLPADTATVVASLTTNLTTAGNVTTP